MISATLVIEEYEDGAWEELLTLLHFPIFLVHRGVYEVWRASEEVPDEDAAFESAIQFLRETSDRLRELRSHLRNPMRLTFRYPRPLWIDKKWIACSTTIPSELIRLAGELGLCVELEPYFEVKRST